MIASRPPALPKPQATACSRACFALYLASLALLPWSWFPPFPWLHEHAQWSDALFAAAAACWVVDRWQAGDWPRLRPIHGAIVLYFVAAALSLLMATPDRRAGAWKLLGVAELCCLAVVTSDLLKRPGVPQAVARTVAATSLATAAAAVAGLLLFYARIPTLLVGTYGDLNPSRWYARMEAGTIHPHMLASFCIFASSITGREDVGLPVWLRRVTQAALWLTVGLTFSRAILGFTLAAALRSARTRRGRILAAACAVLFAGILISLSWLHFTIDPSRPLSWRFEASSPSRHSQKIVSSLHTLAAHPLWGSGIDTHPARYYGSPADTDLTPLNIAATLGLPALAAFTTMIVILWRSHSRPLDRATWGGLAGIALDALACDVEDFRHIWVLIGLADASAVDNARSHCQVRRGSCAH
jgi:hypothetical protein